MAKNCEVCGREFSALYPKTTFEKHEVCKVCKKRLEISEKNSFFFRLELYKHYTHLVFWILHEMDMMKP